MNNYYQECLIKGLEYQDFVMTAILENLGIPLTNYSSEKYQIEVGENKQGIEIKFDDKYKDTGNLYIEIAEKRKAENPYYVQSGIMRDNNSWLYVIGDYKTIFIFGIEILKLQFKKGNFKEIITPTSKGFLLNKNEQRTALKILTF